MKVLQDPLAKPVWPVTDELAQQTILSLLSSQCVSNVPGLIKGFNNVMAGIEKRTNDEKVLALFVARSDLDAAAAFPFALVSAAYMIPLVSLPKGSTDTLNESVFAITTKYRTVQVINAANKVGPVNMDWVYQGAHEININKGKGKITKNQNQQNQKKKKRKTSATTLNNRSTLSKQ